MRYPQLLFFPLSFVLLAVLPTGFLDRLPSLCMYQSLFGIRCLGCGMTHAFSCLLHGHAADAVAYNPLVLIAFPCLLLVAVRDVAELVRELRGRFPHQPV